MLKHALLTIPLFFATTTLRADPLDVKTIPSDAKWVLHLDADALVKTQTWKLIDPKLQQNPQFTTGVANLERIFAAKFPQDLHSVTLFGPGFDPATAVVVIQASVDQERLKTLLSVNDSYSTQTLGGYTIHGWVDKGKQLYGGFAENNRLIIGQTPQKIADAMDTLAGKADPLKDDTLIGGAKNANVIAYVAGSELAKLAQMRAAKNPIVGKLQSAWLSATEDEAGAHVKGHIIADDAAVAQNLSKSIDGIKAALSFAEQDDPNAAFAADALNGLSAKVDGKAVDLDWTIPTQLIGQAIARREAATQPR